MPSELQLPGQIDVAEFISKEAHDLKSPFNRILGFTKLVLRGMDGPISDQAKEDLSTAYNNSLQALSFMSSLIEMARLSRGERRPHPVECQMDLLIKQVIVDWKKVHPKETHPDFSCSSPPVIITADEAMIRQCLSSWLSYVVEFAQEGIRVEVAVEDQPQTCLFTIYCQGKRLLLPSSCTLTMYGFIATHLLELLQGEIVLAQEDDHGAIIKFNLPKASL